MWTTAEKTLQVYCESRDLHHVLAHWDDERNAPLTPETITIGSSRKVWWRCERGHAWQSSVFSRVKGAGCPVCAGRTVIPGENDLASRFPDLAQQWHLTKNGDLTPEQVTTYCNKRVWWQCDLGHEWRTSVAHRTSERSGCPVCAGRKVLPGFNDLATKDPAVAAQWHPELNGPLTPEMVTPGSNKRVWWQCADGHVWKAAIYARATGARKTGCPVCAGKVKKR